MQAKTGREGFLRRTILGLPIFLWVSVAIVGTAVAVVGFMVTLGMTGQVTTGEGIDVEFVADDPLPVATNTLVGSCSASATATNIEVLANGLISNDYCYTEVTVVNSGPEDAAVQTWFSGQDPASVHVNLNGTTTGDYCGAIIPGDGSPVTIGLQVNIQPEATPGYQYDWAGAPDDGLQFVRADLYDAGGCF